MPGRPARNPEDRLLSRKREMRRCQGRDSCCSRSSRTQSGAATISVTKLNGLCRGSTFLISTFPSNGPAFFWHKLNVRQMCTLVGFRELVLLFIAKPEEALDVARRVGEELLEADPLPPARHHLPGARAGSRRIPPAARPADQAGPPGGGARERREEGAARGGRGGQEARGAGGGAQAGGGQGAARGG